MDTKAPSDRSMTLMHYLAKVLRDNFPELVNFVHELTYLEKAAPGIAIIILGTVTVIFPTYRPFTSCSEEI